METPPFGGRDECSAVGGVKDSSISQGKVEIVEMIEMIELIEMIPHRLIFYNSL